MKTQRIEYLDYAKAFAILSVLFNHSAIDFLGMNCFTMAVFFISSGYTYNSDKDSLGTCFVKKMKRLMVPFWIAMAASAILEMVRATFIGYGSASVALPVIVNLFYGSGLFPNFGKLGQILMDIPPFAFNSKYMIDIIMPTNCQLWALPVMFSGYMIFYLYRKIVRKKSMLTNITAIAVMLLLASIETIPGFFQIPFGIGRGFVCAAFMIVGFEFREHEVFEDTNMLRIIMLLIVSVLGTIFPIFFGSDASGMVISNYGPYGVLSVVLTFICGLCSSYAVFMISRFIHSLSFRPLNSLLSVIGRNTMEIFLWHFTVFFVFDAVFILIFDPVLSPNIFFDELFSEGYLFYRILRIALTMICLCLLGEFKTKMRIKKQLPIHETECRMSD